MNDNRQLIESDAVELVDNREKLEDDVRDYLTHGGEVAGNESMWRFVMSWLDRQAEITERETVKQWEEQASELACHANELEAERDEWKAKAEMYRRQLGGLSAAHARLKKGVRK